MIFKFLNYILYDDTNQNNKKERKSFIIFLKIHKTLQCGLK